MKLFKRRAKPDSQPEGVKGIDSAEPPTVRRQRWLRSATSRRRVRMRAGRPPCEPAAPPETSATLFGRLRSGLSRSRGQFTEGLASLVLGKKQLDPELLEALEEQLIMADLGLETTERVLESLRQRLDRKALSAEESVLSSLKETLIELLEDQERALSLEQHKPFVILVVGVNGAGKTTTIGKLAHRFKRRAAA